MTLAGQPSDCTTIREQLADGAELVPDVVAHLAGCEECRALTASLSQIDDGLATLGMIDAPDELVRATIARAVDAGAANAGAAPAQGADVKIARADAVGVRALLVASLAAIASALGAVVLAPLALVRWLFSAPKGRMVFGLGGALAAGLAVISTMTLSMRGGAELDQSEVRGGDGWMDGDLSRGPSAASVAPTPVGSATVEAAAPGTIVLLDSSGSIMNGENSRDAIDLATLEDGRYQEHPDDGYLFRLQLDGEQADAPPPAEVPAFMPPADQGVSGDVGRQLGGVGYDGTFGHGTTAGDDLAPRVTRQSGIDDEVERRTVDSTLAWHRGLEEAGQPAAADDRERAAEQPPRDRDGEGRDGIVDALELGDLQEADRGGELADQETDDDEDCRREITVSREGLREDLAARGERTGRIDFQTTIDLPVGTPMGPVPAGGTTRTWRESDRAQRTQSEWWATRQSTEGLAFQPRDGWWSNTYVPGDPALRVLHRRLAAARDVRFGAVGLSPLALAETASTVAPALAAPTDRALAIGVHADVAAVQGPTRVRLELAMRGIAQAAGRRGALRVAVVIDARQPLDASEAAHLRALLASLGDARSPRDRVIVTAAGPHGGTLVPLGAMRHGEVEVALRRLLAPSAGLAEESGSVTLEPVTIEAALTSALEAVASDEAAGLVLLATPDGAHDATLDRTLHAGAVAGVVTSAVAIGDAVRVEDLDAIALAGQGRRRVIGSEADAASAVRAELEAASRLVARAIRLQVRLAPGVQLIGVVGSRALDAEQTARTRQAEQAIDRDLAARLGIASDRDEDDDGIRIFVPSFYSGDSHVVLLDLVVAGPGPIGDVDVRYKDLVTLGNGRASTALTLAHGAPTRGPRELRVVAALLGHEIATALSEAGDRAHGGDVAAAHARIQAARDAIDAVRAAYPALARDRSLTADASLCDRYLALLGDASADRELVVTSLRYAARRRVVTPLLASADP